MSIDLLDFKHGPRPGGGPDDLARLLHHALRGLRFGTVEIVVHEGHVVQLERREKFRLGRAPDSQAAD